MRLGFKITKIKGVHMQNWWIGGPDCFIEDGLTCDCGLRTVTFHKSLQADLFTVSAKRHIITNQTRKWLPNSLYFHKRRKPIRSNLPSKPGLYGYVKRGHEGVHRRRVRVPVNGRVTGRQKFARPRNLAQVYPPQYGDLAKLLRLAMLVIPGVVCLMSFIKPKIRILWKRAVQYQDLLG